MQHADEMLISVVVLELGSSWPPWLSEYQRFAPNSVVVAQSSDESAPQFATRIERRMNEIGVGEAAIHVGLLVSNGAFDSVANDARERICQAMLRVMLQKHQGELVLAADTESDEEIRHELFALAGTLCDGLRGKEVTVRVRFGSTRPSGIMKAAPVVDLNQPKKDSLAR